MIQEDYKPFNATIDRRVALTYLGVAAVSGLVAALKPYEALAATLPQNSIEIGKGRGLPVLITETDKYLYARMGSGWDSTKMINGHDRTANGKPIVHHGLDWVKGYGEPVLAGANGEVIGLYTKDVKWGSAIFIKFGNDKVLVKYHFSPDSGLVREFDSARTKRIPIRYSDVIGTESDLNAMSGSHTHEHVERGVRIGHEIVPHPKNRNLKVDNVHIVSASGAKLPRENSLDYYFDNNPETRNVIEVASIKGPEEATKYSHVNGRIILGYYAELKSEKQAQVQK